MNHNQNYRSSSNYDLIPVKKIVKWTYIPYLGFVFLLFLEALVKYPTTLLEATKMLIFVSGWGYLIILGPFILVVVGINYFTNPSNLANIPKDTTLYETITQPTMMYGPIKMVLSKSNEETANMGETKVKDFQNLETIPK